MLKFFAEKMWVALQCKSYSHFFSNEIFCWKNVSSFCSAKATHIFSAQNFRKLYIESAKTVNKMNLNELVKLTTLWTTRPWCSCQEASNEYSQNMFLWRYKKKIFRYPPYLELWKCVKCQIKTIYKGVNINYINSGYKFLRQPWPILWPDFFFSWNDS